MFGGHFRPGGRDITEMAPERPRAPRNSLGSPLTRGIFQTARLQGTVRLPPPSGRWRDAVRKRRNAKKDGRIRTAAKFNATNPRGVRCLIPRNEWEYARPYGKIHFEPLNTVRTFRNCACFAHAANHRCTYRFLFPSFMLINHAMSCS